MNFDSGISHLICVWQPQGAAGCVLLAVQGPASQIHNTDVSASTQIIDFFFFFPCKGLLWNQEPCMDIDAP